MTMGLMQVIQGQISIVVLPSKTQYFLLLAIKKFDQKIDFLVNSSEKAITFQYLVMRL